MKTGIVGGTFDPIHAAHCYLMEECQHALELDRILVIPNGDPPHKETPVTSAAHRLAMVRLALAGYENLTVSDLEVRDPKPSYTYRTMQKLKTLYPEDELYFIMGSDSLINFQRWYKPEIIMGLACLVCFDRPNYRAKEVAEAAQRVRDSGGSVIQLDSLELEISSTDIRNRVARGIPHRAFLHPAVFDYIRQHGLYRA